MREQIKRGKEEQGTRKTTKSQLIKWEKIIPISIYFKYKWTKCLNASTKRHQVSEQIFKKAKTTITRKQDLSICCVQETQFSSDQKTHILKVKG